MRIGPFAAAALVVLVAAGCGGSSSSSSTTTTSSTAATWADGVCTALVHYRSALTSARTSIRSNGLSKDSLKKAAESVRTATKSFVSDVRGLPAPQTAARASAQQTLSNLATQLQTEANAVREATSNGSSTLSVASTIQTALAHAKTQLSTAVDQLKQLDAKGELKNAFAQSPACANAIGA